MKIIVVQGDWDECIQEYEFENEETAPFFCAADENMFQCPVKNHVTGCIGCVNLGLS